MSRSGTSQLFTVCREESDWGRRSKIFFCADVIVSTPYPNNGLKEATEAVCCSITVRKNKNNSLSTIPKQQDQQNYKFWKIVFSFQLEYTRKSKFNMLSNLFI